MGMISKETIDKIMDTVRIEEVIGEFVNLKKSGQNYKGFSPFTEERNPSFFVSPAKNIFKCFSSNKGGSVVTFLMEHEHYTYPEALRFLAKKYGIEIEETEQSPEEKEKMDEREALFQVNAFAQKYFNEQLLKTDEGKSIGLSYFKEREYNQDIINKFGLGYSPESWDALTEHSLANGYKLEYLVKTGLTIEREDKKRYDRFRARVIFPVYNLSGRVVGFGGRILTKEENKPKYVNSPESVIYNKSNVLYGLNLAKSEIVRQDKCYLVEGYTDVISMYKAGFENVVASSGTALTPDQIRLIKRFTKNITILYDGDQAGIMASFRGIDLILEQGMNVRIIMFPPDEDPDTDPIQAEIKQATQRKVKSDWSNASKGSKGKKGGSTQTYGLTETSTAAASASSGGKGKGNSEQGSSVGGGKSNNGKSGVSSQTSSKGSATTAWREPIEISTSPLIITIASPIAAIKVIDIWPRILETFRTVKKYSELKLKKRNTKINMIRSPSSPMSEIL